MKGVARCVVGYSGGKQLSPTYRNILDFTEALLIEYDPSEVAYEDLVVSWTQMHHPSYRSKTQYRSAIWYMNEEQKEVAQKLIKGWEDSSREALHTNFEPALVFYKAEEYHQNFMQKKIKFSHCS